MPDGGQRRTEFRRLHFGSSILTDRIRRCRILTPECLSNFASRVLNGKAPLIFEDGRQQRDFVSVYDVATRLPSRSGIAGGCRTRHEYFERSADDGGRGCGADDPGDWPRQTSSRRLRANTGWAISATALRIFRWRGRCSAGSRESRWSEGLEDLAELA